MKLLIPIAALALSGCAMLPALMGVPAPAQIADQTIVDESAGLAIETAYAAAAEAGRLAIEAGVVDAAGARRIAEIDRRAYAAVVATRTAYDAGNASTYRQAANAALPLLRELLAAIKGE